MPVNQNIIAQVIGGKLLDKHLAELHPAYLVELTTRNSFISNSASEMYSDKIITLLKELIDSDSPIPIDGLLGEYRSSSQEIIIYKKAISLFAGKLGIDNSIVEYIVRVHEYSHALFHLGNDSSKIISDIDKFNLERNNIYNSLTEQSHEFIAQSLTYAALFNGKCWKETDAFKKMMEKQPEIYRVDIKAIEEFANDVDNWFLLLDAIRSGNLSNANLNFIV